MTQGGFLEPIPQVDPLEMNASHALLTVIERVAMSPDADLAKLEKMLDMQERVLNRNAKQAFASAFAHMQAELPEIDRLGKTDKGKYARFEDINEAVRPILQRHGFGVSFRINQGDGKIAVTGVLSHCEGHTEETDVVLPADTSGSKNSVQAVGSSISYGKRYALCALLNISTRGEDDNGAQAGAKFITQFQQKSLMEILDDCSTSTREWFVQQFADPSQVTKDQFTTIFAKLKAARDKAKESDNASN
jgi:hypothetical protein